LKSEKGIPVEGNGGNGKKLKRKTGFFHSGRPAKGPRNNREFVYPWEGKGRGWGTRGQIPL